MKFKAFSVYDDKAKAYLPPFFLSEQGQAIRHFYDALVTPDHAFYLHPGDYTLVQIGGFDDSSGVLSGQEIPENLGNGLEVRARFGRREELNGNED